MQTETVTQEPIAIIGLGCVLPDAPDIETFWNNLLQGRNSIREVSPERWDPALHWSEDKSVPDKTYAKIGGFVADDAFEGLDYRLPPKVVEQIDPCQRWALSASRQAFQDAGYATGLRGDDGKAFDRDRCAVILGNAMGGETNKLTTRRLSWPEAAQAIREDPDFQALPEDTQAAILRRTEERYKALTLPITEDTMPGHLSNVVAGRIANAFDLSGKNFTTDAACASSLAALDAAVDTLRSGDADMVVWGGTDRSMDVSAYVQFSKIGALSPDGSRPFDKDANGFVMGEGCAMFLLKRLSDAERDGDPVYAVVRGVGGSSDGKGKGITAPNPAGQVKAVRRAYEDAGIDPATIGYLEAHGTSTPVGDPVELESVMEAFNDVDGKAPDTGSILVGSVKSNIGHLKAAAGAAGVLKAVLALHHGRVPPSINVQELNPRIDWDRSAFRVATVDTEWLQPREAPRRAAVSSFGFGGTNFHIVLEQFVPGHLQVAATSARTTEPAADAAPSAAPTEAGDGGTVLDTAAFQERMADAAGLEAEPVVLAEAEAEKALALTAPAFPTTGEGPRLRDLLHPLTAAGLDAERRVAFHVQDVADIPKKLAMAQKAATDPAAAKLAFNQGIHMGEGRPEGKVAFLFPGQGTQYVNMGRDLAEKYAVVRNTFAEADEALFDELDGVKLTDILWPTPDTPENRQASEEKLKLTEFTQPAVLAMDVALLRLLRQWGLQPDVVAGHSLGEYGALVAAGVLTFTDALHAVAARGREMAHVEVPDLGKMASVPADWETVQAALEDVDDYVICANKNCPSQTVIAGSTAGVEAAVRKLTEQGLQCMELPVSAAFHSEIVAPASEPLRKVLGRLDVQPPKVRVLSNVGTEPYTDDPEAIRDNLAVQVASPVEWIGIIERMHDEGVRTFIEVGPKRALTGFVADILKDLGDVRPVFANHPKKGGIQSLNELYAFLGAHGFQPALPPLDDASVYTATFRDPTAPYRHAAPAPTPEPATTTPAATAPTTRSTATEDPRIDTIAKHLEALTEELRVIRGEAPAPTATTSPTSPDATGLPPTSIGVSGISVGLPGRNKPLFAEDDWDRILRGENLIDVLGDEDRQAMVEKHITRLVKSAGGQGTFEAIDDPEQVIKLAGRSGPFDLREWGVPDDLLETLDVTSQYAMAAGLEALHDAGIPLQRTYKQTSTGGRLPTGWALPKAIGDRTGIVFASAFPGYDALLQEVKKAGTDAAFNRKFLFHVLSMGHSQLAQFLGARGPNTQVNAACASTTQAIAIAEDWIKAGRCDRVLVVGADDATSDTMLEWIGSGFLASGAATTKEDVAEAALPFDARRHGMIVGMGAVGLVVEKTAETESRGMRPIAKLLATQVSNSAYHGSRLDVDHIAGEMQALLRRAGMDPKTVAPQTVFMSHETYTPARGGSAAAEIHALRATFGDAADKVVIANTKGYTGHPQGAGIEDAVALKCLQRGQVPPIPHLQQPDPELGDLNLSQGGDYDVRYALRLAAGFGSQVAMTFTELVAREHERMADPARYEAWLAEVSGLPGATPEVVDRTLRIVDTGAPEKPTPEPVPQDEAPVAKPVPDAPAGTAGGDDDAILEKVTAVVAEKTGYPLELLEPDLDLEADLGIDTVKQAELFGELREHFGVPLDESLQLKDYNTLRKVAGYMGSGASPSEAADRTSEPQGEVVPDATAEAPTAPSGDADEALAKVTAVVAEKTGYPEEMLEPDLDLEADLGIDTVKQAELFGELRELFGVPLDESLQLKDYNTLRKVAGYMGSGASPSQEADGPSGPESEPGQDEAPRDTPSDAEIVRRVPTLRPEPRPDAANDVPKGVVRMVGLASDEDVAPWKEVGFDLQQDAEDPVGILCIATEPGEDAGEAAGQLFEAAKAHPGVRFIAVVTAQDGAHGLRAPRDPAMAALAGLGKALRKERPDAVVKTIDLDPEHPLMAEAVHELRHGGPRTEVCYDGNGTRFVVEVAPEPLDAVVPDVAGKAFVVAGGAQGITAELLARLAPQGPKLLLLGRTPLPEDAMTWADWSDEDWKAEEARTIEALKAEGDKPTPVKVQARVDKKRKAADVQRNVARLMDAGAEVLYAPVDVLDKDSLTDAIAWGRGEFGGLHGIIHAAGIEVSKPLDDKPRDQFDRVFAIKHQGLQNLLAATAEDDLEWLVGFGSVAGRFGNIGQTDYSAANEALAKGIVQAARDRGVATAFTVAWGPWGELGMATRGSIMTVLKQSGVTPIPTEDGAAAFLAELAHGGVRESVVAGELGMLDVDGQVVQTAWDPAVAEARSWLQTAPERFRLLHAIDAFHPSRTLRATVRLDRASDPYLPDHAIEGTPLLPGVFGMEAFAEAARLLAPEDQDLLGADDVRFAAPLKQHKDAPLDATLDAEVVADGDTTRVRCRLTSRFIGPDNQPHGDPRLHFEATLRFGEAPEPLQTGDVPVCDGSVPRERIYPPFFHGPSFQVLSGAGPMNDTEAIGAWVRPGAPLFAAGDADFLSHPLVTEGLFQLCGLRTLQKERVMSLPAAVERLDVYAADGVSEARLWCRFTGTDDDGLRRFDAAACTPDGRVLVRLVGYAMVETGPVEAVDEDDRAGPDDGPDVPPASTATEAPATPSLSDFDDGDQAPELPVLDGVVFAAQRVGDGPDGRGRLTETEQDQASSFGSRKRAAEWVAGRLAAKDAVREAAPELTDAEITLDGSDGPPRLLVRGERSPATLSITHRDGWALAALGDDPLGIDLETVEPRSGAFWDQAFTTEEQERLRTLGDDDLAAACAWAAKEACLKRSGQGLTESVHALHVTPDDQGGATVEGPFGTWGVRFYDVNGRVLAVTLPAFDADAPTAASPSGTNA